MKVGVYMADKKPSIISKVRNGEKLSVFERFFPLFIPFHVIGHALKAKDSYSAYKKRLVQDIGSGKQLSSFDETFSIFHPFTVTKGLFLKGKNHRKEFLNSIEHNILTGEPKLSIAEQFREIYDFTCWPTVAKAYWQKFVPFKKKKESETVSKSKKDKRSSFLKKTKAEPKSPEKAKIVSFHPKSKEKNDDARIA